jgi:hypothetical protein
VNDEGRRAAVGIVILACLGVLVLFGWALRDARDRAELASRRAAGAERAAVRAARQTAGSAELVASCEAQARAELDSAHARIRALEVSLRAVAATNPCRVRLPAPVEDAPRPLMCEDRTSWWAEPLPTLGVLCYPPEARVLDWAAED